MGSAYASFDEQNKGSITAGKLADFVVLSEDPRSVPVDRIKDVAVETTVVGGQVVYQSESHETEEVVPDSHSRQQLLERE